RVTQETRGTRHNARAPRIINHVGQHRSAGGVGTHVASQVRKEIAAAESGVRNTAAAGLTAYIAQAVVIGEEKSSVLYDATAGGAAELLRITRGGDKLSAVIHEVGVPREEVAPLPHFVTVELVD